MEVRCLSSRLSLWSQLNVLVNESQEKAQRVDTSISRAKRRAYALPAGTTGRDRHTSALLLCTQHVVSPALPAALRQQLRLIQPAKEAREAAHKRLQAAAATEIRSDSSCLACSRIEYPMLEVPIIDVYSSQLHLEQYQISFLQLIITQSSRSPHPSPRGWYQRS